LTLTEYAARIFMDIKFSGADEQVSRLGMELPLNVAQRVVATTMSKG